MLSAKTEHPQDAGYWINRRRDDPKQDWTFGFVKDWIHGYQRSAHHPHRNLIIKTIAEFPEKIESVFEVGCSAGPNLIKIKRYFPSLQLGGVELNKEALKDARKALPAADIRNENICSTSFSEKCFDLVISDAVFLYISPERFEKALSEIDRIAKKGVIFVEWDSDSLLGEIKNYHWARDYKTNLEQLGFKVEKTKLTQAHWPHPIWSDVGYLYVGYRPRSPTLEQSS